MTAAQLNQPEEHEVVSTILSPAEALLRAADLIRRRGLCRDFYEGEDGSLCPAGAVALVLGCEDADAWSTPTEWFYETGAYDVGFAALYALVAGIGRWDMAEGDVPWNGDRLANHLGWWLEDVRPSAEQVIHEMRAAAAALSVPAEIEEPAHA